MIWPIGQPRGVLHELALVSRSTWCQVAQKTGLWLSECGSLHLAHRDDELQVLTEFSELASSANCEYQVLTASQVRSQAPAANPDRLLGGLWSPTEMCVDPPNAVSSISRQLQDRKNVDIKFGTAVRQVDGCTLVTSAGSHWRADRILVANGADFQSLFPDVFAESNLVRCKLQMLKTRPQPNAWKIGPLLASGLTLRHYANFAACPSIDYLRRRIAAESPELDRHGIHVMASQNEQGAVILGDSHQYGASFAPGSDERIDALILRELQKLLRLEDWSVARRWSGVYAKHPTKAFFEYDLQPGIKIVTGLGGAGMTLSFGVAQDVWRRWS